MALLFFPADAPYEPLLHRNAERVVEVRIGLFSKNNELIESFTAGSEPCATRIFRNLETPRNEQYDLLAVDADLFDSSDVIQFHLSRVRKKFKSTPVLLIPSVKHLDGIDMSWFFDDIILYPFRKGELAVRIKRLLWQNKSREDDAVIELGSVTINPKEYLVYHDNEKVELTYKEFELLRLMVQNRGVVFSRKELLANVWGLDYIGGTRTVDVHIRRLRGKLGDDFNSIIETVRNVGYRCIQEGETAVPEQEQSDDPEEAADA